MAKGFGARVLTPQQEKEVKIIKRSILKHFQCLKEPRTGRRQDHNLTAIVTIGILAVLSQGNRILVEWNQKRNLA